MKEEEIRKLAEDYIDSCTKKSGFVILAESLKGDFIDLFVAGFMKCLEINKSNEWHYVKDKLPKESGRYLVYVGGGENGIYPLDFDTEANDFGYWCLDVGENLGVRDSIFETVAERNEDAVIAWKEIKLPEQEGQV